MTARRVLDEPGSWIMIPYDIKSLSDKTVRILKVPRCPGAWSGDTIMRTVWAGADDVKVAKRILGIVPEKHIDADRWIKPRVQVQGHYFESLGLKGAFYGFGSADNFQYTHCYFSKKITERRRTTTKRAPAQGNQIREVCEELKFPSRDKLKAALKKRSIQSTEGQLDADVKKSGGRQIYAPRSTYPGKVATYAPDTRWAADTTSLVSNPSSSGHAYILVVVDQFTRQTWATPLMDIKVQTVANAFEFVTTQNGPPTELNTDEGVEFFNEPFQAVLRRLHIAHRIKVGREDLSVVDRRIQLFKQGLLKDTASKQPGNRASRVGKAVRALNNTATEPLMGSDPIDVEKQPSLEFERKMQGAIDAEKNQDLAKARVNKLLDAGAFRPEIPANNSSRSLKPRFGEVETLADITNNAIAVGESGKQYALRYVNPVPTDSTAAVPQTVEGSAQPLDRARCELMPFATRVRTHYTGQTVTLHAVARYLRGIRGFEDATRKARIRQRTRIVSFLRQFLEFFIETSVRGKGEVEVS